MTELREKILKLNNCFAEHLISVQKAKYKPSGEWSEGDSVILDDSDEVVVLTKDQAEELNTEELQYFLDNRDEYNSKKIYKWIGRVTLISSKKTTKEYLSNLGQSLTDLSNRYGDLLILGDWNTPWLNQENDYQPVLDATNFLKQKIDKKFNGGFILNSNEISEFITHLFWLIRCNASLPEFMITFNTCNTIFGICKYGILHIEFYDSLERITILNFFDKMKFKEVESCNDPIEFTILKKEK